MNRLANRTLALLMVAVTALVGACGAWKPAKLDATTAGAIDERLPSGLAVATFRQDFPQAVLVEGNETSGRWFVHTQHVCFWCRTAAGFQRSEDVYARIVRFEDGRLAGIDPVDGSR